MKKLVILLILCISFTEIQAQWANITFHTFECVGTNDFDGSDEIKIEINGTMYDLGSFSDGESKSLSDIIGTLSFKNSIKVQVIEYDGVGFINDHDYMPVFYPSYDDASAGTSLIQTMKKGIVRRTEYKVTYTVTTN